MDNKSICILGRLPAIATAELESLFGSNNVSKLSSESVLVNLDPANIDYKRLGGTVKLCQLLHVFDDNNWDNVESYLMQSISEYISDGSKKLTLGLSAYSLRINPKQLLKTGLRLKKVVKANKTPFRLVPNTETALSSAQVYHNKLTKPGSIELCFIGANNKIYMAKTIHVQDINAYSARDQARPKRDAKVGMLSPKLAQTIINLANPAPDSIILDPFCGTGVILQEALLMGFKVIGTDLEPRMIDYSKENIDVWLRKRVDNFPEKITIDCQDATKANWQKIYGVQFSAISSETYLGRPLSSLPAPQVLDTIIRDVDTILKKFLKNIASQTPPKTRLCIAVPAWKTTKGFLHLPLLDHLETIGYTRIKFVHAKNEDLVYYREGQIVCRELLPLIRKS